MGKASRRHRQARIYILTALPHEGKQMAEAVEAEGLERVEVWSFRVGEWARWKSLVQDQNDIIGESTQSSMNLVLNGQAFMTELERVC